MLKHLLTWGVRNLSIHQLRNCSICKVWNLTTCRSRNLSICRVWNLPIAQSIGWRINQPINCRICQSAYCGMIIQFIDWWTCQSLECGICQAHNLSIMEFVHRVHNMSIHYFQIPQSTDFQIFQSMDCVIGRFHTLHIDNIWINRFLNSCIVWLIHSTNHRWTDWTYSSIYRLCGWLISPLTDFTSHTLKYPSIDILCDCVILQSTDWQIPWFMDHVIERLSQLRISRFFNLDIVWLTEFASDRLTVSSI